MADRPKSALQRILYLTPGAYGSPGGIARFNRDLLDVLARRGEREILALALHGQTSEPAPPGLDWRIPAPGRQVAFALAALGAAWRFRPQRIVSALAGFGPLALPAKMLTGARLWTLTYGVEVWQRTPWLDALALRRSERVITISRSTRDRLLAWCPLAPERVHILPTTVDLERFRPGPRPAALVDRYGVAGRRVLLTVGRLNAAERYKGQDRVIRVLPRLRAAAGPLLYLIVGDGDDRPRLEALARSCGVEASVRFVGQVGEGELVDHYRLADVFVMPSLREGFGIVFLEAMACGCPVVGGNRDGSVDALADGELGRLVDPLDEEEIARGILDVLAAGRQWKTPIAGVERFAAPRFARRVEELFGPG